MAKIQQTHQTNAPKPASRKSEQAQKPVNSGQMMEAPETMRPEDVLAAQQQVGNQVVQRALDSATRRQGLTDPQGNLREDITEQIQKKRGAGIPLPDSVQKEATSKLGRSFDDVRIHTDPESDQLSRTINARAFTIGKDIFFKNGAFSPASSDGRETIIHELTHVVQQGGKSVGGNLKLGAPDTAQEKEADQMGKKHATSAGAVTAPGAAVQRAPEEDELQMQGEEDKEQDKEKEKEKEIEGGFENKTDESAPESEPGDAPQVTASDVETSEGDDSPEPETEAAADTAEEKGTDGHEESEPDRAPDSIPDDAPEGETEEKLPAPVAESEPASAPAMPESQPENTGDLQETEPDDAPATTAEAETSDSDAKDSGDTPQAETTAEGQSPGAETDSDSKDDDDTLQMQPDPAVIQRKWEQVNGAWQKVEEEKPQAHMGYKKTQKKLEKKAMFDHEMNETLPVPGSHQVRKNKLKLNNQITGGKAKLNKVGFDAIEKRQQKALETEAELMPKEKQQQAKERGEQNAKFEKTAPGQRLKLMGTLKDPKASKEEIKAAKQKLEDLHKGAFSKKELKAAKSARKTAMKESAQAGDEDAYKNLKAEKEDTFGGRAKKAWSEEVATPVKSFAKNLPGHAIKGAKSLGKGIGKLGLGLGKQALSGGLSHFLGVKPESKDDDSGDKEKDSKSGGSAETISDLFQENKKLKARLAELEKNTQSV